MRKLIPATAAVLLLVSCSNDGSRSAGGNTDATPVRDLNLASQAANEPLVLSSVERQSMSRPAAKGQGKVRLVTTAKAPVPRPTNEEAASAAVEMTPSPSPEVIPDAPAPAVEVASSGFGQALAPGQTVSSIPASGMGSGDPPAIQTIARGGAGIMVRRPDDNCAPHAGVIAINRVYNPSQGGFRRF